MAEEAAVDVGGVGAGMGTHFLEHDAIEAAGQMADLGEPSAEAEVAHAATLEAGRLEGHRAGGDRAVSAAQRPSGVGAEIECENDRAAGLCRRRPMRQPGCGRLASSVAEPPEWWKPW
jgi:hypothetical protein